MSADAAVWLSIADGDIDAVRRSLAPDPEPNLAVAAYHCQQAAEKLVKALLVHAGLAYPRGSGGHDLGRLVEALPAEHPLRPSLAGLISVTPWATAFRYPADDPLTAEPMPTTSHVESILEILVTLRGRIAVILQAN